MRYVLHQSVMFFMIQTHGITFFHQQKYQMIPDADDIMPQEYSAGKLKLGI
jgi:hypothetical protein